MSRKVVNLTHSANKYDILSQTPKNYDKDNYFLKELQEKVSEDWRYRPNRVDVEFESEWGEQVYEPLEVVVQSVLSEKGTAISNDTRNLVFKNILEDRFDLGNRFRFSEDYDLSKEDDAKNVWMVTNQNKVNMTSSVVVERCNGTLGSTVENSDGTVSYHYEPVIQGKTLTSVNFSYNETLLSPQSQLLVIAQHNKYTAAYKINQRFIIGYDKVYRIKAMNKFYGKTTFDARNVGFVYIYMEICEDTNVYDDFEHRIAYQGDLENHMVLPLSDSYVISLKQPEVVPNVLTYDTIVFQPVLQNREQTITDNFNLQLQLENLPEGVSPNLFVDVVKENGLFKVHKIRDYVNGNLLLTWSTVDPNGETKTLTITMYMTE
jgi:hypothetical protein